MKYTDEIEQKVLSFIEEYHMISPGERVTAGISGGADSVCLFFVLLKLRESIPFTLEVVHVNHLIREEAGEDADFVEALCRRFDVHFTLKEADVRDLADAQKCSEEEMGRMVRYEALREVSGDDGIIAVAHNADDQAETVLFRLFRGSGINGLGGMAPVSGQVIRPLLCLERGEIEAYLRERGISWKEDSTNAEDDYARNRIRHHIIPVAENEIVSGCVRHVNRTAAIMRETESLLEKLEQQAYDQVVCRNSAEEFCVDAAGFLLLDPALGKRLIYRLLCECAPHGKNITYTHVEEVFALFEKEGNRSIDLAYGITAIREFGKVTIGAAPDGKSAHDPAVSAGDAVTADFQLVDDKFYPGKCADIPQKMYTKWFDYDKIKKSLTLRTRQKGDFIMLRGEKPGQMIRKSLSRYMIDSKIPKSLRDQIVLLADGEEIVWIVGYRISESYKVSENTKRILQVNIKNKEKTEDHYE